LFLFLFAAHAYNNPAQIWRLLLVACCAVAVSSCYGFVQLLGLDPFPWADRSVAEYQQLPATLGNPNYAGHVLVMAVVMALGLGVRKKTCWALLLVPLFLAHLHFIGIRAGAAALAAAALLMVSTLIVRRHFRSPVRAATITLCVTLGLGVLGILAGLGLMRLKTGAATPLDASILLRYNSYYSAAAMVVDRPMFGFGPGNYQIENTPYWTPYEKQWFADEFRMNKHVHNDFVEAAVAGGLPGAFLYLTFLSLSIGYGLLMAVQTGDPSRRKLGWVLAAVFAAFAVDGLFGFNARVPVSACILFVMAGALEGLWQNRPAKHAGKRRIAAATILGGTAIGFALICAVYETRCFSAQRSFQIARAAKKAKLPGVALAALRRGAELTPWDWLMPYEQGRVYVSAKRYDLAIPAFEQALALNPYYVMTLSAMANAYMQSALAAVPEGKLTPETRKTTEPLLAKAVEYAQRAQELAPELASAEDVLGRVLSIRAIQTQGNSPPTSESKALWKEAHAHLTRALSLRASNRGELSMYLAQASIALDDISGADKALERAVALTPNNQRIWDFYFDFASQFGRYDRLETAVRSEIKARQGGDPNRLIPLLSRLAEAYQTGLKQPDKAQAMAIRILELAPERMEGWRILAAAAGAAQSPTALRKALAQAQERLGARSASAPKCITALAAALSTEPPKLDLLARSLAEACRRRAPDTSAQALLDDYAWLAELEMLYLNRSRLDPKVRGASLNELGQALSYMGQHEAAERVFAMSLPDVPEDEKPRVLARRGEALARVGRTSDAVEVLHQASERAPEDASIRWALARALAKAGQHDRARREYTRLAETPNLTREARRLIEEETETLPE